MSDTEDVQAKRRMSDSSSASSADEDSSMAKKPQELDNSGFRVDGEPMNKPRKVARDDSDSDSSDSEAGGPDDVDDDEDDSSTSRSRSNAAGKKSVSSVSSAPAKEAAAADDDDSSSETADDVSKSLDDVVDDDQPAVKVTEVDEDEVEAEVKVQVDQPEEDADLPVSSVQVNVVAESDSDESEGPEDNDDDEPDQPVEEEEDQPVEEPVPKPRVNGSTEIKRPQFRHSSSSLSDEEIPVQAAAAPAVTQAAPAVTQAAAPAVAAPAVVAPAAPRSPSPVEEAPAAAAVEEPVEAVPAVATAASPSPVSSAGLDERKRELLQAASSPTPPPAAPQSPLPTRANASNLTKIYTGALESNNNNNGSLDKGQAEPRAKPAKDITQIYTAGIVKTATPPASPKPVPARNRDITQLYTGGFNSKANNKSGSPCMTADKLNPQKHNMSTTVERDAIRQAYEDVRCDTSDTQWAVFKFDESNRLKASGTGKDFKDFKASFSNEDRGFGYIRINTGDEMSKRAKFVFVTWVGPSVSVMKKAKMSTDKALMKDIIQNMSVELQFENHSEFSQDFFKSQVDKAAGARYGTGERAL